MRTKMQMDKFIKAAIDAPKKWAAATSIKEVNTMGKEFHCDFCRGNVPIETALQDVVIGKDKIAEACLTCASNIKNNLKKEIAQVVAKMNAAAQTLPAAQANAPPVAPPAEAPAAPAAPAPPAPGGA